MNALDEAKMAHHKTPQQEIIERLQAENLELKERLVDYQRFVMAVNAQKAIDALEDWFNSDIEFDIDDDDDEYNSDNGELNNGIYGLTK